MPTKSSNKQQTIMILVAAAIGIVFWLIMVAVTGMTEAWDSPIYFRIGFPVLIFVNFFLGVIEPDQAWRWGLISTMAQVVPLIIGNPTANLLPLGIVLTAILSLPVVLASYAGGYVRGKFFVKGE